VPDNPRNALATVVDNAAALARAEHAPAAAEARAWLGQIGLGLALLVWACCSPQSSCSCWRSRPCCGAPRPGPRDSHVARDHWPRRWAFFFLSARELRKLKGIRMNRLASTDNEDELARADLSVMQSRAKLSHS